MRRTLVWLCLVMCAFGSRVHHDPLIKRSKKRYAPHERRLDTTVSYDASASAFASLRIHVHFAEQQIVGLTAAKQGITVRKQTPDSFFGTDLAERLAQEGVEHLIVCGYSTEFCIDRTVFSAASRGYKVTLADDAHTTHDKPHLDARTIIAHHSFTLSKHPNIELTVTAALVAEQKPA